MTRLATGDFVLGPLSSSPHTIRRLGGKVGTDLFDHELVTGLVPALDLRDVCPEIAQPRNSSVSKFEA